jgi:hypothetical protein
MQNFLVLNDMPEELTLSAGKVISWIQIAKTGAYQDPRYGKFKITLAEFKKWMDNFQKLNKANGRLGLPIDVDHNPETKGDTEAAGWLTELDIRGGGTELWAKAEWNTLGQELVKERRYAYISPSYVPNLRDEHGTEHGTGLLGVALTNRPFLSMATVSLSKLHTTTTETYTPDDMPIDPKILTALGLGADADEATVLSKVTELTAKPTPQTKTLAEMASAQGMIVLSATEHAVLSAKADEGANAAKLLKDQRFETAFTAALNDSKGARVLPTQKDGLKTFYDAAPDACILHIEALPSLVNAAPVGSGGSDDMVTQLSNTETEGFDVDADMQKLDDKAKSLMAADSNLTYSGAVSLAMAQLGMN